MMALLVNAVEASGATDSIIVRAWNKQRGQGSHTGFRTVEVEVEDSGSGITPEDTSRIFDPYFSTKVDRNGLGLTVSHSIIARHGGKLTVQSAPGVGTRVRFSVPTESSKVRPADETPGTDLIHSSLKVLVMDDEPQVREIFGKMLEVLGHEPVFASEGEEAISTFLRAREEGSPFDIHLLDLTIPGGMGGRETARRLLELDPEARMIVVSGYSNDPVLAQFEAHGFCARLAKPVSIEDLQAALARTATGTGTSAPPKLNP